MLDQGYDFQRLLHPVSEATFVRDYWQRQPLVLSRDQPDYYAGLLSLADIDAIVGYRQLRYSQLKIARTDPGSQDSEVFYVDNESTADVNRLFNSYCQGDTAVFNFAQRYWEPAAMLCAAVETCFGFPAGVNVYFTPPRAQGFAPHYDNHDVFVVQVEGSKLWRVYDAWEELPIGGNDNQPLSRELLPPPRHEVCLNAGDLLYIPRGFAHEACTTESSSVHCTVGVRPYTWSDLLSELLAAESRQDASLRQALPVGWLKGEQAGEPMVDRLAALGRGPVDGQRIDQALDRLRERLIERMRPLPDGHFRSLDRLAGIRPDTLVARRKGMLCLVRSKRGCAEISFPGNRIQGPAELEAAFRFMAEASEAFAVRDLPGSLGDNSKLVLARRAIREGLLTVVDDAERRPPADPCSLIDCDGTPGP